MNELFTLKMDTDFYVWMKSHLPGRYHIQAEPSSDYYSEWKFRYMLFDGVNLMEIIEGDFRDLPPGALIRKAKVLVDQLGMEVD